MELFYVRGLLYLLAFILILTERGKDILFAAYEKYKRRLLALAEVFLKDEAEDIVHDAYIKITNTFNNKEEPLEEMTYTYLYLTVKSCAIDRIRKERRLNRNAYSEECYYDEKTDETVFIDTNQTPEQLLLARNDEEILVQYIKKLKPIYRTVLEYSMILRYSNIEIAALLGITPSAVSTRLNRGKVALRKQLRKEQRHD